MITTIKEHFDWVLGASYGLTNSIFLMLEPGSPIDFWQVVARTIIVTAVAFLSKKFLEWTWNLISKPWDKN